MKLEVLVLIDRCQSCDSKRIGIEEGRIHFKCGSYFNTETNKWRITSQCFNARQGKDSEAILRRSCRINEGK